MNPNKRPHYFKLYFSIYLAKCVHISIITKRPSKTKKYKYIFFVLYFSSLTKSAIHSVVLLIMTENNIRH